MQKRTKWVVRMVLGGGALARAGVAAAAQAPAQAAVYRLIEVAGRTLPVVR